MDDKYKDYVCYIPIHANYGQVESISPFLEKIKAKVFVYSWNTDSEKMTRYFEKINSVVKVQAMNPTNLVKEISSEPSGTKILFLLTSSKTYSFGTAQYNFFRKIQEIFPSKVKDVFTVGHCMYGCDSCSISEHRIPLFFTRYVKNTLPLNGQHVQKKYLGDKNSKSVLICPSVQEKSFLTDSSIVSALISIKSRAPFNDSDRWKFLLKLHPHCFLEEKDGVLHPIHAITGEERENVELLKSEFELVLEEEFNILPFIERFDIILTDLDSSVPFESLYFENKAILAYRKIDGQRYHAEYDVEKDSNYLSLLNIFSEAHELEGYLRGSVPMKRTDRSSRAFFASIYGDADGTEVDSVAMLRDWFGAMPQLSDPDRESFDEVMSLLEKSVEDMLPTTYLARGLDIPIEVLDYTLFVANHKVQLDFYDIPQKLWRSLYIKLRNEIFDAGSAFQFGMSEEDAESSTPNLFLVATRSLKPQEDIFLIDHAWTTTTQQAKKQLESHPQLLKRIEDLLDIAPNPNDDPNQRIENAIDRMWYITRSYRVTDPSGSEISVWYVMDELGSRINHSDDPNIKCTHFMYLDKQMGFSLIWPESSIEEGEIATRDYVIAKSELDRVAKLYILSERLDVRGVDIDRDTAQETLLNAFRDHKNNLAEIGEPIRQYLDQKRPRKMFSESKKPEFTRKIKVYSDTDLVDRFLTHAMFQIVRDPSEADILWYQTKDLGNFDQLKPSLGKRAEDILLLNQYPNEKVITYKHLMVDTLESYFGDICLDWISPSYNLDCSLAQFVGHYINREIAEGHQNNVWIVKPWNFARGIEIVVSRNLIEILRLSECGPKLASIYITPALYDKRKFDLRYIVIVRSIDPLEVYLFKMFWIRLANVEYSLDQFDNYEKHFTVMNYSKYQMTQLLYTDFIKSFEEQYPDTPWSTIQTKINDAIYNCLLAAKSKINNSEVKFELNHCSSMYGVDVMVDNRMNPKILEINFAPDCTRACNYDPEFYNVLFAVMFTNDWYLHPQISERVVPI